MGIRHLSLSFLGMCSVVALLAGCGASHKPRALFDLTVPSLEAVHYRSRKQVLIPKPSSIAAYDSERIVVRSNDIALSYFPHAAWADRLPVLLQSRMVEAFERSGKIRAVSVPGQGFFIDAQLILELRSFEVVIDGIVQAEIRLFAKIMNDANGRLIASREFSAYHKASSDNVNEGVDALNHAFASVSADLVNWTLKIL